MASITIRNLDEKTKVRLRVRAANHKRSMEEEARNILRTALAEDRTTSGNLAEAIRRRFEPLGGVNLTLPAREAIRESQKPGKGSRPSPGRPGQRSQLETSRTSKVAA